MALQAIFFDLDDTLIGYVEAERAALAAGSRLVVGRYPALAGESLHRAVYRAYTGRYRYGTPGYAILGTVSVEQLRRELTDAALADLGIHDPELTNQLIMAYAQEERRSLSPFPGTVAVLEALQPCVRLGIITNGPAAMQRAKLCQTGLAAFFDPIVIDTEFGCPKPDPRLFEHAASLVGASASELLFVGNSLAADIVGARSAGWTSVWLNREATSAEATRPDYEIAALGQLLTLAPVVRTMEQAILSCCVRTKGFGTDN